MASDNQTNAPGAQALAARLAKVRNDIAELEKQCAELDAVYRRATSSLNLRAREDLAVIRDARREVEQITSILHGTELFGRYAENADHHLRIANRWRYGAVATLLISPCVALGLALAGKLEVTTAATVLSLLVALFLYASIESNNHRRREFDRRRIALRVSAIESFTKQRREGDNLAARRKAEKLLDDFVRMHFIAPELDSNDITQLTPRGGMFRTKERATPPASKAAAARRGRSTTKRP